jgi:hypothetical protein
MHKYEYYERHLIQQMLIREIRHKQWDIADSITAYLRKGKIMVGRVDEIIRICGIKANGHEVGKFLQRAESMPHSPFIIRRTVEKTSPGLGIVYRITLKGSSFS